MSEEKKEPYKFEAHNFCLNVRHWPYCVNCGLVMMKNSFSDWAVRVGCRNKEHPSYAAQRAKTNPFDKN